MAVIDEIDKRILSELQEDASLSNLELSKRIGLSPSACLARTKNLSESGIIKKYTVLADEKKLGINVLAYALVDLAPLNRETIHSFLDEVKKYPQILECYTLTGSHDCLLKIVAKDMESYRDFIIDSLMQNSYISRIETNLVMGTEKRTTSIPLDDLKGDKVNE